MKKYILFDFDGVIIDSFHSSFGINKKIRPGVQEQQYRDFFNGNIYEAVTKPDEEKMQNDSVRQFFHHYELACDNLSYFKGMPEVIKELSSDYTLIIISSTVGSIIEYFLCCHNLRNYFVSIMGPEVEYNKTKKIEMVFEKFKTTAKHCLFITDTLGDIKEARKVKVDSLAVAWGYHSVATLELGNPLAIADQPSDLPKLVRTFLS